MNSGQISNRPPLGGGSAICSKDGENRPNERPAAAVAETLTYSTAGLVQRSDEAEENSCERIDGGEGEDSLERGHFSRKLDLPTE
jgi:hypothetical protein